MATVDVTAENFNEIISNNDFVIVDFWAPWCGPCKGFAPVYEELSEKYPDVVFAKVNTEDQQQLAGEFQIRSIPTLMIFREQIILFSQPGALQGSQLEQVIEQAQGLDMEEVKKDIEKQQAEEATKQ
ncbi:MAG: thioredoxin [gamma proteobacterium symbiont of Bathyaustriella thionipta]|nr:thioredoxin [gamma proteobacterium symbiont of Bathyaustriella thionipta]MCU7949531.1 thioredoxin [gamma proteobacterium symbiont of Bathyaustriella thionipta]MCU7954253.1 thioredoxin [gamma proteobacterium symbiont of Bathyaustriella thionipta]MCU7956131.1 thioredoxin [gamma proteobacterium symbiont of Bathyaustriella thionipta]MCU7968732.1 thioredoxin [gamma proteobacterium symbiont of Bathyaustriella thionipta]